MVTPFPEGGPGRDVLIPGFSFSSRADELFESIGCRLAFALDPAERARGYARLDREEVRQLAIARHLQELAPSLVALKAQGGAGPLAVNGELLDRLPNLRVVFIGAAGFDKIDVDAATSRGVMVVNAAGANARGVAEHTLGLMLALARQIALTDRHAHREGAQMDRADLVGGLVPLATLAGKTVGIVGLGAIGREVAALCRAFRMRVVAHDPVLSSPPPDVDDLVDLDVLFPTSDVVTLHAPLVSSTRNVVDADALHCMKSTSWLINTSRGELVDTEALTQALQGGVIAGAGLDVTHPEPLPVGHALFGLQNVVITPHIGGVSPEMVEALAYAAAAGAVEVLSGRLPSSAVNPQAWDLHCDRFGLVSQD